MSDFLERLRALTDEARNRSVAPPPSAMSGMEAAHCHWGQIKEQMWTKARAGCSSIRYERYIDSKVAQVVVDRVCAGFQSLGFVWRHNGTTAPDSVVWDTCEVVYNQGSAFEFRLQQPVKQPVMGAGCYSAGIYGSEEEEEDSLVRLVVEASWLTRGFCLSCGEDHVVAI